MEGYFEGRVEVSVTKQEEGEEEEEVSVLEGEVEVFASWFSAWFRTRGPS